jgi:DNA modification methylase
MILTGDCLDIMPTLEAESVQCCCTSPPYWGLRDYGCDGQLGLESTPEAYVEKLVAVFREVRRVLRDDGTLWLNLGDSYASNWGMGAKRKSSWWSTASGELEGKGWGDVETAIPPNSFKKGRPDGIKVKDLIGIPWRVALALQADGWYLRQDIIWAKPNPMPESVTDRCTKSHEYIFLLTKSARYFYDAEAVKEPFTDDRMGNPGAYKWSYGGDVTKASDATIRGNGGSSHKLQTEGWNSNGDKSGRNRRSVWTITTKPFKEAHFATFPPEIPEICIKAGSKPGDTILDPFSGAGTTGLVAEKLGRKYIGIELNPSYVSMSESRIEAQCGGLFNGS